MKQQIDNIKEILSGLSPQPESIRKAIADQHATICQTFLVFIFILLGTFWIMAEQRLTADSLWRRISYQTWSFPQEKIYVSTDRDAYVSGDTIRFRAFLVDASTHMKPKQESKYIYVDLVDPFGNKVQRIKVMRKDDVFAGLLPLDEEMPEGNYTLSAYTQFMQNSGNEYFFRKSIPVFNQLSGRYRFDISTENGRLKANLYERGSDRPVRVENISITGPDGEFLASRIRKRSDYSMNISDKMRKGGHVMVKFDKYEKFVPIPDDTAAASVSFHPEGGHLVPGVSNRLAFKAVGPDGLSREITGRIIDETGKHVCDISSAHKGMGMVEIVPEQDRSYSALIDGRSIPLPQPENLATVLTVDAVGSDSIAVKVSGYESGSLFLIAHNGGVVSLVRKMPGQEVRLDRSRLGSGIVQLLLTDEHGDIMSSRMIFNHSGYIYSNSMDSIVRPMPR